MLACTFLKPNRVACQCTHAAILVGFKAVQLHGAEHERVLRPQTFSSSCFRFLSFSFPPSLTPTTHTRCVCYVLNASYISPTPKRLGGKTRLRLAFGV